MLKQPQRVEIDPDDYEEQYDETLNELYGDVQIAGCDFSTSYALKELDPTAYRCGLIDYVDSLDLEKFECPVCGEQYDDEDDALYCCQDEDEIEDEE